MKVIAAFVALSVAACLPAAHARTVVEAPGLEPSATELERAQEHVAEITSVDDYLQHLEQQRVLFESGELGRTSRVDRRRLESANDQIRKLLEGQHSATDLDPRNQVALFNAQEAFDAVLLDYSDPLVCVRERRTGSNFVRNTCRRQSEIDLRRDADQAEMRMRPLPPRLPDQ